MGIKSVCQIKKPLTILSEVSEARRTGLEPATSGSTVRCSNQLSYHPKVSPTGQWPEGDAEFNRNRMGVNPSGLRFPERTIIGLFPEDA